MQCCVPFCKNTSEQSDSGISFHSFPSDMYLHAAWLRALGKEDTHLPDSPVVCSKHFLNDDIYVTESGLRKIHTSALPSIILVCMICLDTDSKLLLLSKSKLGEAYEKLSGHALCDQGKIKQTVCILCAQRLINFSKFRDKSLRAHAVMMNLIKKNEPITELHLKMIKHTKNELMSNLVVSIQEANPCDLYIQEEPSGDIQTDSKETELSVEVKSEDSDDSIAVDNDMEMINDELCNKDDSNLKIVKDPLKYKNVPFQCTLCSEDFIKKRAYLRHIRMHIEVGDNCDKSQVCKPHTAVSSSSEYKTLYSVAPLSARHGKKSKHVQVDQVKTLENSLQVFQTENRESGGQFHTSSVTDGTTNSAIKFSSLFKLPKKCAPKNHTTIGCCKSQHNIDTASKYLKREDIRQVKTKLKANKRNVSKTVKSKTNHLNNIMDQSSMYTKKKCFSCDICRKTFKLKGVLVNHMKIHCDIKPFNCKLCHFKSKHKDSLASHMRTHTGEKPYLCELCDYRCDRHDRLLQHMRRHTGEKPFSCKSCHYKCTTSGQLVRHTRIHTGERPYSCKLCGYKCTQNSDLVKHTRTHTGDKPYACKLCQFKCVQKSHLVQHTKTQHGQS